MSFYYFFSLFSILKQVNDETSFILALKNIRKISHMITKHKKTLNSNRKKKQMIKTLSQIVMPCLI